MADPLTTTLRLTEPTVGGDSGTWGTLLNSNMAYIDEAVNQTITVSIPDTNVTLTADGSSGDQARYARYDFTGALTATRTVTLPTNVKIGYATNDTTGGHTVTLSAGASTLDLTDTSWTFFAVDGSNNVSAPTVRLGAVNVTGNAVVSGTATVTGAVTLSSTLHATGTATVGNVTCSGLSELGTLSNLTGSAATLSVENPSGIAAQFMNSKALAGSVSVNVRNDRTDGTAIAFLFGASTTVGSISQNGTTTTYATSSDARLKEHVGGILNSGAIIDKLIPRWFRWKAWPDREMEPGFFAQQVHRVFPWAVVKGHGKPDGKNFKPWQMDAGRLMPVVIAELQSLRRRVAELEK